MHKQDFQKNAFEGLQILVVGDVMIDRYFYGNINRQSPEADVPILDVDQIENRLGGAANVALNIAKMGAKAHLMSIVGRDEDANLFKDLLREQGVCFKLVDSNRRTSIKSRLYKENEYLMRYDVEDRHDIEDAELEELLANVKIACERVPLNAIVLQDYNKGVFTQKSIQALIDLVKPFGIPIVVDPKENNFFAYKSVDLFKPNLKEVNKALSLQVNAQDDMALEGVCKTLLNELNCKMVLITRAQFGAIAANDKAFYKEKGLPRKVVDVSGAGDTVIAMASLLLSINLELDKIVYYSNLAGASVIEERGVKALDLKTWEELLGL